MSCMAFLRGFIVAFCWGFLGSPVTTVNQAMGFILRIHKDAPPDHTHSSSSSTSPLLGPDFWAFHLHLPLSTCSLIGLLVFQPPPGSAHCSCPCCSHSPLLLRNRLCTAHCPILPTAPYCPLPHTAHCPVAGFPYFLLYLKLGLLLKNLTTVLPPSHSQSSLS